MRRTQKGTAIMFIIGKITKAVDWEGKEIVLPDIPEFQVSIKGSEPFIEINWLVSCAIKKMTQDLLNLTGIAVVIDKIFFRINSQSKSYPSATVVVYVPRPSCGPFTVLNIPVKPFLRN